MSKPLPSIRLMPKPPKAAVFSLQKVESISTPHPYCITPAHVAWAAYHNGGMLTTDAIRESEKHGACCDICKHSGRGTLSVDQHVSSVTLFIIVPQNTDLNAVPGLHTYLYSNKKKFEKAGIEGFAFPTK